MCQMGKERTLSTYAASKSNGITYKHVTMVLALFLLLIFIYLSFAAAYALAPLVGTAWAFVIVAAFYLVIFLLLMAFRKQWIERPVVKFLASLLMKS